MNSKESNLLLEPLDFIKRGYSGVIANVGKIIAAITLSVAILVTFTDVAFSSLTSQSFTTSLVVMLIASYLMYFSLEEAGEREAEECEEYKNAKAKYLDARSRITPEEVDPLRKFCLDYSAREWKYRRLCYLSENGLSETDFNDYKGGKVFRGRARRILRRAERIRAVNLTPSTLLNRSGGVGKSELQSPMRDKILSVITSLIPSTVCTLFTVSVILTAKDGLTVESVIEGLLKLSALPIVGFRGMLDGYRYAKESKSAWFETKARLLESFLNA